MTTPKPLDRAMTKGEKPMISKDSAPSGTGAVGGAAAVCDGVAARDDAFKGLPDGEFYSCTDPESLTHRTPEEALEEWLDDLCSRDCDVSALIREWAPVTLSAYRPMAITAQQIKAWADAALDDLADRWGDEHCDPDEPPTDQLPADALETMTAAVEKIASGMRVWSCEVAGAVTLDAGQVEAVMRECRPDWFEPAAARQALGEDKP